MAVNYKQNLEGVYENREQGKVQPTIEQHYASIGDTKLQNENVYQDIEILSEISSVKIASQKGEKKKGTSQKYLCAITLVAMVASILAIVGVIIVAGVYVSALQENTATLTRQIVELENKLNQTHNTAMTQLSSLQSSMNTLNAYKSTSTSELSSLQSSVNTLTTRVNSPVNLYQNCSQETRSCTNSASGSTYAKYCTTPPLHINITVSILYLIYIHTCKSNVSLLQLLAIC